MQHNYFAASNSSDGFKNYYPQVFERADRLYIIKGGPGTGKSSFMKKCAAHAEKQGGIAERYYCSSDPASLDGVLILGQGETVGILDGTAPHVWEPVHPGVREEIVNLGQFWDSKLLREQKNEIFALSNKKSAAYKRAYDYLRSCGNLRAVTDSLLSRAVDLGKLRGAAERLLRSMELPHGVLTAIPAVTSAVAMTGYQRLDSFEQNAQRVFRIGDIYGVGSLFLDALTEMLEGKAVTARISYDPINARHVDGILLEDTGTAFVLSKKDDEGGEDAEKSINPKRFLHPERLREIRGEMRYAAKLYDDCRDGALHALGEAKVYHFLLEDIYKHAMDFNALTEFTREFTEKLK